jgi:choline dehydrogenase-like flavoprotein
MLPGLLSIRQEDEMKKAVVVGSGAGGATAAKELQGKFQVTVLEAGHSFHPFTANLNTVEKIKKTGLLFDEKEIQWIFPAMKICKTGDGMVLVKGVAQGGSTTLSAGNAVRQDQDLKAIGIDLDAEFRELYREIPVSSDHQKKWTPLTREVFGICRDMGLHPQPTPKMISFEKCAGCGKCVLGCPHGAKWDSRRYLEQALEKGAALVSGCSVQKVVIEKGRATGVIAVKGRRHQFYPADLVVLAAGGLGTPVVLQQSGIECRDSLFVDPVLCVASRWEGSRQNHELPMPFIVQKDSFIISPYFDFLSFFFNRNWKYPAGDIFSLMVKLADTSAGSSSLHGVQKSLQEIDKIRLNEGARTCRDILRKLGLKDSSIFMGTLNAGHPGGMLPLSEKESLTLHSQCLPENLYVADASLLPGALGNPPILTIAAIAKRISKVCLN